MAEPKILILDIEWKPTTALVWQAFNIKSIPDEAIVEHGGMLCVGAKWLDDKDVHIFSEWQHGHKEMVENIIKMIEEADALVGFNSDRFDIPKIIGEGFLYGLSPVAPTAQIDLYKAVKKFGYFRSSLGFVSKFLNIGAKLEHEGMALWKKVMSGDKDAQRRMERYCIQDVLLTEKLFLKIRPYIRNLPNLGATGAECPSCGGTHSHSRGKRSTRHFTIQRLCCQTVGCGHWYDGKKSKK